MSERLKDKVAIITGAASGIGRATAILFAREGAKVTVVDIDAEKGQDTVDLIRKEGGEAVFVQADLTKSEDAKKAVQETVKAFGTVDILHNNAGIWRWGTVVDTSEEDWDKVIAVNLKSYFLMSKYAIPEMLKAGGGCIINTASIGGLGGVENASAYAASKGGVVMLTKSMARDFGPRNIRVNCVCPGTTETPMLHKIWVDEHGNIERARQEYIKNRPLHRIGTPEDIAYAALYLASEESRFVTGITLIVDGGVKSVCV